MVLVPYSFRCVPNCSTVELETLGYYITVSVYLTSTIRFLGDLFLFFIVKEL